MAGFDPIGPLGQGPMTVRGVGSCVAKIPDADPFRPAFGQGVVGSHGQETDALRETGKES